MYYLHLLLLTSNSAGDGASARLKKVFVSSCVKHMINRRYGTNLRQFDPLLVLLPMLTSAPPAKSEGNTCCSCSLLRSICFSLIILAVKKVKSAWSLIGWLCSHSIRRVLGQLTGHGKEEIAKREAARCTILVT